MSQISENPVLNAEAAARLRFQEITPEIQERTIPALPPPPPPDDPPVSGEAAEDNGQEPSPARRTRSANRSTGSPGRHRRPEAEQKADKPSAKPKDDKPAPPKVKAPDFAEWHDFGANFVFKWLCRGYVGYVFRGIDKERVLNAAELDALEPNAEMLSSATKPLAHMASRSAFMTKNGRAIIDSADGIEALIAVGMYANTVRRIARSHEQQRSEQPARKKKRNVRVVDGHLHSRSEPVSEQHSGQNVEEPPRIRVVNGESGFNGTGFGVGG